jgi:hypothetical protein
LALRRGRGSRCERTLQDSGEGCSRAARKMSRSDLAFVAAQLVWRLKTRVTRLSDPLGWQCATCRRDESAIQDYAARTIDVSTDFRPSQLLRTLRVACDARQHVSVFVASDDQAPLRLPSGLLELEDYAPAIDTNLGQWTWVPVNRCLSRHDSPPVQISRHTSWRQLDKRVRMVYGTSRTRFPPAARARLSSIQTPLGPQMEPRPRSWSR